MTASRDPEGDKERDRFARLLNQAAARSSRIAFWWRDDDAIDVTAQLERLLALGRQHDLPLALAVVPKGATTALAERLAAEPIASVLQHGWRHRSHSPEGEKKMELGDHRPLPAVLDELTRGYNRLAEMFPSVFLPVLVPPWNRISPAVRDARPEAGLTGLSTFGPAPAGAPHWVNTHLDIIDWATRDSLARAEAHARLCREMERRLGGDPEPIGILTHHLVHTEASWKLLDELFGLIAHHPAAGWPPLPELFGLAPPAD